MFDVFFACFKICFKILCFFKTFFDDVVFFQPFEARFNGAMAACSKVGRWQLSGFLLDDMAATRPKPSEFSFGTAIDSCSRHTDLWDVALVMLEEAREARVAKHIEFAKRCSFFFLHASLEFASRNPEHTGM